MVVVIENRRQRFEALAGEVAAPVLRYAMRRTDAHTADDVLAETLLVAWRRFDEIPIDAALPWCYTVAHNCLANLTRGARRQRQLAARVAALDPPQTVESAPDPVDPELQEALTRLRPEDREILQLWVWEELTPGEIAAVLGVNTNAVHVRLHRARNRLAALLGKDGRGAGQKRDDREVFDDRS